MFHATIEAEGRAHVGTWVYIVDREKPEPLLGDGDAEALGIIWFNPRGKEIRIKMIQEGIKQDTKAVDIKLEQKGVKSRKKTGLKEVPSVH